MQTKAVRVAEQLRREIESVGQAGQRLDAMPVLASRFGVSVNTLQQAVVLLERSGLVERRPGSGVYIRSQDRPRTVGILVEHDILHPRCSVYHTQVIRELRQVLGAQGLQTNLYVGEVPLGTVVPERVTSRHFLSDLAAGRLDAVALICTRMLPDLAEALEKTPVPVVGDIDAVAHRVKGDLGVMVDEAVRLLAEQGRRRIALMSWHDEDLLSHFHAAMGRVGLAVVPEWVRDDLLPEWAGAGWEEFREIWSSHPEKPDGLIVTDDKLFSDALSAIRGIGLRVPEELAIVAHATRGADIVYPPAVTRLEVDPAEGASLLGGMLVRLLEGKTVARQRVRLPFRILPAERNTIDALDVDDGECGQASQVVVENRRGRS